MTTGDAEEEATMEAEGEEDTAAALGVYAALMMAVPLGAKMLAVALLKAKGAFEAPPTRIVSVNVFVVLTVVVVVDMLLVLVGA